MTAGSAGGASGETTAYRRWGKRSLDVVLTVAALPIAVPLVAACALLVRATSPGPAFFRQARLGRNGRVFTLLKLRTMTHADRTTHVEVFAGNPEVTRVGAFLRRTKLDELPQLLHVLRGEMSIVGPRPALTDQWESPDPRARARLAVRPGLTGLSQVHGGILLSWPDRWGIDVDYCGRVSLALDARIVARTVALLFAGEDASATLPALDVARTRGTTDTGG